MYFGTLCYGYGLDSLFGHTRDTSVIYEKTKVIFYINMQPPKVKFTFRVYGLFMIYFKYYLKNMFCVHKKTSQGHV